MQTEKSQPQGNWIILETRFTNSGIIHWPEGWHTCDTSLIILETPGNELKYITFYQNFEISRKWMKNILIYSIHFLKTSRKWKKNLPDASLKFITCMGWDFSVCIADRWLIIFVTDCNWKIIILQHFFLQLTLCDCQFWMSFGVFRYGT